MPRSSAKLTISRQWQILQRLPHRPPGLTAGELADHLRHDAGFSVTKRTIERDLVELATLFAITSHTKQKPYRWRWRDGAKPDIANPSGLDIGEALTLALAEQAITPLLPAPLAHALAPSFDLARRKLAALHQEHPHARWLDKVRSVPATLSFQAPTVSPGIAQTVQKALCEEKCLEVAYSNPSDRKAKSLPLHPLALIQRGVVLYLVASAYDYNEPRLYALHRISRARALNQTRIVPPGFDVDAFIAAGHLDFEPGELITLEARLGDTLASYLTETPLAKDQKITGSPGQYKLTAPVRDSWQLRFWILSQGSEITITSPRKLKTNIRQTLLYTLQNYRHKL